MDIGFVWTTDAHFEKIKDRLILSQAFTNVQAFIDIVTTEEGKVGMLFAPPPSRVNHDPKYVPHKHHPMPVLSPEAVNRLFDRYDEDLESGNSSDPDFTSLQIEEYRKALRAYDEHLAKEPLTPPAL